MIRNCTHCGESFEVNTKVSNRRTCNDKCRIAAIETALAKGRQNRDIPVQINSAVCSWCNGPFQWIERSRRIGKYCRRACYFKHKHHRSVQRQRQKAQEQKQLKAKLQKQRQQRAKERQRLRQYCKSHGNVKPCGACRALGNARIKAGWKRYKAEHKPEPRLCFWCEEEFTPVMRGRFCRPRCLRRWTVVAKRNELTMDSPRELIRAIRLYGLACYAIQRPSPDEWRAASKGARLRV